MSLLTTIFHEKIPSIEIENGNVKIISGEFNGVKGPGMPHTGMLYLDVDLNKGTEFKTSINEQWNTFVYVYDGVMAAKIFSFNLVNWLYLAKAIHSIFRLTIQMVLDVS